MLFQSYFVAASNHCWLLLLLLLIFFVTQVAVLANIAFPLTENFATY